MAAPDAGEPLAEEQASGATAERPSPGAAAERPATRRVSGWYVAGLLVQGLLWLLVFLGIALAVLGDSVVNEFRYVGF